MRISRFDDWKGLGINGLAARVLDER